MKILLSILFISLLFCGSATADKNKFFADFTYWDNLKKVQKNFYAKGALDAWGYYIWNNAPDNSRDILISQFRYCIEKEFDRFQTNMFMLGWEEGDNAANEIFRWSSAVCSNLSKTEEYKNIKIEKNKPIENITRNAWKKLDNTNKKVYLAGYTDGALSVTRMILSDQNAPQDMKDYYTKVIKHIYNCFENKGISEYANFAINYKIDKGYPIPWNMSFSLGNFCKEFK
tara:strand:- start:856 stop:1539 length:684 start_codon:yes stop_codon:yes gene_type:complete